MSNYPVPPPTYGPPGSTQKSNYRSFDDSREPLLAGSSSGRGIYDQPNPGDLPDDFKVGFSPYAVHSLMVFDPLINISMGSQLLRVRWRFGTRSFAKSTLSFVSQLRSCSCCLTSNSLHKVCQIVSAHKVLPEIALNHKLRAPQL